jgi:hypothetical protein
VLTVDNVCYADHTQFPGKMQANVHVLTRVEASSESVPSDGKVTVFEGEVRDGVRIKNDGRKEGFDKGYYVKTLSITKTI